MEVNEYLHNVDITHQHYTHRYKNELIYAIALLVSDYRNALKDNVLLFRGAPSNYMGKVNLTQTLLKVRDKHFNIINSTLKRELRHFAVDELDFYYDQLRFIVKKYNLKNRVKQPKEIEKSIFKKVEFDDGTVYSIDSFLDDIDKKSKFDIVKAVNYGARYNKNSKGISDGVYDTGTGTLRQYAVIIPTLLTAISSFVKGDLYGANAHMIAGYQWASIMDGKTSDICLHLNDNVWYYDFPELSTLPGPITPPAHFNCRSSVVPIFRSAEELELEFADFTGKPVENLTYANWFESQNDTVKEDILGPSRYSMYRKQDIKVSGFFTDDGRRLTLSQLKAKNYTIPKEFEKYVR